MRVIMKVVVVVVMGGRRQSIKEKRREREAIVSHSLCCRRRRVFVVVARASLCFLSALLSLLPQPCEQQKEEKLQKGLRQPLPSLPLPKPRQSSSRKAAAEKQQSKTTIFCSQFFPLCHAHLPLSSFCTASDGCLLAAQSREKDAAEKWPPRGEDQ